MSGPTGAIVQGVGAGADAVILAVLAVTAVAALPLVINRTVQAARVAAGVAPPAGED